MLSINHVAAFHVQHVWITVDIDMRQMFTVWGHWCSYKNDV